MATVTSLNCKVFVDRVRNFICDFGVMSSLPQTLIGNLEPSARRSGFALLRSSCCSLFSLVDNIRRFVPAACPVVALFLGGRRQQVDGSWEQTAPKWMLTATMPTIIVIIIMPHPVPTHDRRPPPPTAHHFQRLPTRRPSPACPHHHPQPEAKEHEVAELMGTAAAVEVQVCFDGPFSASVPESIEVPRRPVRWQPPPLPLLRPMEAFPNHREHEPPRTVTSTRPSCTTYPMLK